MGRNSITILSGKPIALVIKFSLNLQLGNYGKTYYVYLNYNIIYNLNRKEKKMLSCNRLQYKLHIRKFNKKTKKTDHPHKNIKKSLNKY